MTAAMHADRTSRRASIVLLAPGTCLSSPEPDDPDLLRCWRVNSGADSDLMGLLMFCPSQKGLWSFLAPSCERNRALSALLQRAGTSCSLPLWLLIYNLGAAGKAPEV